MNCGKIKHTDIITFIVSAVIIAALVASGGTGRLSLAMASLVFFGGVNPPSVTQKITADETVTAVTEKEIFKSSDITETPSDIKDLIQKYTKLFADDKKDGDIKSVTYKTKGATDIYGNVRVKNNTESKTLDIQNILSQKLDIRIDKTKPAVLIFHSHTSESYEMIEREWYACDYTARSNDENRNIVRVGTEIADYLENLGYTVIHDKTIHDEDYSSSYPKSRKTIENHLKEHPEIKIILDIHRDAITQDNGEKIKPVNTINGKKAAQLMIITGVEEGKVEDFPDWEYNLQFALHLQNKCETMFPGLMRPVLFSQRKYNMDMTRFSLLIEMGSEANTLEEACYSGRMLAAALASLMEEYEI